MAAPVDVLQFKDPLIVLGSVAVVIPVFHSLRLSPILGYILIGMSLGPFGLGALAQELPWLGWFTISGAEQIKPVAELGVVLLLFMIGLELSLERLKVMRRLVFGLGLAQTVFSAVVAGGTVYLLTGNATLSVVAGLGLAMSSTAVVIQVLSERKQLNTPYGRATFATLLFQDIAVIPILFAIGMMGAGTSEEVFARLGVALGQAALAVAVVILAGRTVLRPLFNRVARTRSPELFMAACLLVILGTGLVTAYAGLSMVMGALIAGLLLAETEYRRQIEVMIEPFKGLLVGVFLISIGMSVDTTLVMQSPFGILGAALALVLAKTLIVVAAALPFGLPPAAGIRAGLLLGAGSEFTFVILSQALDLALIDQKSADFLLIVAALTMAAIPILHALGGVVAGRLRRYQPPNPVTLIQVPQEEASRVIIAGFGRVGRVIADLLTEKAIPWIAIDTDADAVSRARAEGQPVYYGDVRSPGFLRVCGIGRATALVVTMDNPKAANEVVRLARAERRDVKVIARARDARHASDLYRLGATEAVPETVEASLQLGEAVLVDLGIPTGHAIALIHAKRSDIRAGIVASAPEREVRYPVRRRLRDWPGHN